MRHRWCNLWRVRVQDVQVWSRVLARLAGRLLVSIDGMSVWALDRDKNVARQFSLEGEK